MNDRLRTLCLDVEGGHGGSSRSLYALLAAIDRSKVAPEVWCRRDGAVGWYSALGIPCHVEPRLPRFSAGSYRLRNNLSQLRSSLPGFARARPIVRRLARLIEDRFDVVHFNHTAFFALARWLRCHTAVPFVMHMRTQTPDSFLARWQVRTVQQTVNKLVFITENERRHHAELVGPIPGEVIYNPLLVPEYEVTPLDLGDENRFKIASVGNYSWYRGIDRLIDVATQLAAMGRRDFLFIVAGDTALPAKTPEPLEPLAKHCASLSEYAAAAGVADMFLFLGHTKTPERALVTCDAVAALTRESNPWGRTIIEALSFAKPVISIGTWDRFVEHNTTGFLYPEFDAMTTARDLIRLSDNRDLGVQMGLSGRTRVEQLCSPADRANDLLRVWLSATGRAAN